MQLLAFTLCKDGTYTMLALYQCGFSSTCEERIPLPRKDHSTSFQHQMHPELDVKREPDSSLPLRVCGQSAELMRRGIFLYLESQVSLL